MPATLDNVGKKGIKKFKNTSVRSKVLRKGDNVMRLRR